MLGDADVYAHSGGQYEWDSAAPVAVAAAAGLHVSRLDGSPLRYNQPDPWLPDVLICRPDLADAVIRTLSRGRRVTPRLTHLQRLEAESIQIMREAVAASERPVMLYSIGKDSSITSLGSG